MSLEVCNSVSAPNSLDVDFFQEALENGLLDVYIKIKKISIEMGSKGGDNYCSQIYRVLLTYQRGSGPLETTSVIVKSIPVNDNTKFLEQCRVFLKEKIFYYNMLPRMEILMNGVKFGAMLFHTVKEPISTLVFEDLSARGYVMADREQGLDLNHCKLVMKKIGQFHGVSMILNQKDSNAMSSFSYGMLYDKGVNGSDLYEVFFGNNLQGLINLISQWKGYESITEKIKRYGKDIRQNLIKSQQPIPGELKVLNHGDLWVNNLLFKYKNNNKKDVEDVVFVDLQMSIFGSPGYDLNYFFYTSVQLDILKEKREELLRIYHTAMCDTLKAYNFKKIPSFGDILTEVRRREKYGFFANYGIFPPISMDKSESGDNSLDNFMDEEKSKKKIDVMFSSKRMAETMRYTLKRFDELGVLD